MQQPAKPSAVPQTNQRVEDHYFSANPPPKDLAKHVALARDFIDFHAKAGRRLVLVTSGGTTVPLGPSVSSCSGNIALPNGMGPLTCRQ